VGGKRELTVGIGENVGWGSVGDVVHDRWMDG